MALGLLVMTSLAGANELAGTAQDPQWQRLLHLDGRHSRIDSSDALLAAGAPNLALAELQASIAALADPARSEVFQCRFPARTRFLRSALPQRAALWSAATCPDYQRWRETLAVDAVTLVLASSYLNNPSSMFGHTLLRLDRGDGSPLLAFAVNYAAQTQDQQGPLYAYKGLTGGYPGRYGIYPYYDKVQEYARIENRDLWEYEIRLEPEELDRLLAHLWELRNIEFDYFFLDENCSYQLLALLEVARPSLQLTRQFGVWVSPVQTIRVLAAQPGLLGEVRWRPALQTRLAARLAGLEPHLQQTLTEVLEGRQDRLPEALAPVEQARLAELVHDWAYYQQRNTDWISGRRSALERDRLGQLAERALAWRSRLPAGGVASVLAAPLAPDRGHAEQRLSAGTLWNEREGFAASLGWRPVLHDLLEPPVGFTPGAAIDVLQLQLAVAQGRLRLRDASVIRIESLSPRTRWFRPWSWQVDVGYERPGWLAPGYGRVLGGIGASWGQSLRLDTQVLGQLLIGPKLVEDRGAALGLQLGLRGGAGSWRFEVLARQQRLVAFAGREQGEAALDAGLNFVAFNQQWQFRPSWGLRLSARQQFSPDLGSLSLSLLYYF